MTEQAQPRYGVTSGGRLPGGKAAVQIVGGELEAINQTEGDISAESVVQRARTPGTPLNAWDNVAHYFEWDDSVAAEEHRREQARQLIRAVKVIVESGDQSLSTRAFYAISAGGGSKAYKPVGFVAASPEAHREIKERFENEILRIDGAYRAYLAYADFATSFSEVFSAVDAVIDKLADEGEPRAVARRRERYRRQGGRIKLVPEVV